MKKIKIITLLFLTVTFSCKNKSDLKEVLLETQEDISIIDKFSGYYSEKNVEKFKLKGSDLWVELKINSIEFYPRKYYEDIKTRIIKEDRYSEGREIIVYGMKVHITLTNLNNRYIEFFPEQGIAFNDNNVISGFNEGENNYDLRHYELVKLEANNSETIFYNVNHDYDETFDDFYIGPFNTTNNENIPIKAYFKVNFKSKKVIDKLFLDNESSLSEFIESK